MANTAAENAHKANLADAHRVQLVDAMTGQPIHFDPPDTYGSAEDDGADYDY